MPRFNGWDFLNGLNELQLPPYRIYILSSFISQIDIDKAITYNIVGGYIVKPLSKDALTLFCKTLNSFNQSKFLI